MNEETGKRKRIVLGVMLIAVVVVTLASTFAYFVSNTQSEPETLTVTTGTLALTFSDNNVGMTLNSLQFGQSTTKQFKIENTGTLPVTTNMLWHNLINTYTEGSLTYTFEYGTSETGPWTAIEGASGNVPQSTSASDKNLAENLTIPEHETYYYQLTITLNHLADVDQTSDKDAVLSSNFKLGDKVIEDPALVTLAKLNVTPKTGNPTFASAATTDEGVYSMADDYGTSYYYRGAVENNYVKFAGFYWRIIRVNGDGSLRMIYDGTVAHKNGGGNSTFTTTGVDGSTQSQDRFAYTGKAFNSSYNDNAYVGWMYGQTGQNGTGAYDRTHANTNNSTMKDLVNSWYDTNLASYDQYIADAVYCTDRSLPGKSVSGWSSDTGLGYGANATAFGTSARTQVWNSTTAPVFTCPQKNDAFTVSDSVHGNAIGTSKSRKIGLITADEIVAAGSGKYATTNRNYYLYKASNYWYWSLSPRYFSGSTAYVFSVYSNGGLFNGNVDSAGAVAPVISLKAEYASQLTGSGTASSPYQISGVA